ncbi:MAG: hypothetical protein WAQ94_03345, partial [Bacillota bacterium]
CMRAASVFVPPTSIPTIVMSVQSPSLVCGCAKSVSIFLYMVQYIPGTLKAESRSLRCDAEGTI